MTVLDFLRASGRLVGALQAGQTASDDENAVALEALNAMLDGWNTQRLAIFQIRADQYDLVAATQDYTIGPQGDFRADRPIRIVRANVVLTASADSYRLPLELITVRDWSAIRFPAMHSTYPTQLYYDPAHPLGIVRLWPVPTEANTLELFTWAALTRFASLEETAEFPDGYEEAIKHNLAVRLSLEFHLPLPLLVAELARESLANIKRMNTLTPILRCEPALGRTGGSSYDYRTGD